MKIIRFLLIMSFALCSCLMANEMDTWVNDTLRKRGMLSPKDEGFFGSIGKGAAQAGTNLIGGIGDVISLPNQEQKSALSTWRYDTLHRNQQWNKSPDDNLGECLGHALGKILIFFLANHTAMYCGYCPQQTQIQEISR